MKAHAESDQGLADIWKYELLPLLEEQYFGRLNRDKVHEKFGLPAMLKKAQAKVGAIDLALSQQEQPGEAVEYGDSSVESDTKGSAV
ncbi:hypothetical protein [Arthrobacter sp. E3]|uniref:hypothetical protein n=1 Tax=Arthrobacter sp. E3 TaxID=517402 RepID=UPI001A942DB5|nr:hypothetical protein [Arthrobacter sp. E3]